MTDRMDTLLASGRLHKLTALALLAMLAWILLSPAMVSAFAGLGGYISEKLLGDGTNQALYLGDGTDELSVLGSGPAVSTLGATSSSAGGVVTMTMRGNLQSLNGMPQADIWFQWGYTSGAMVYTTSTDTVSSTGEQTANINPNAGDTVYYQFVASTDGTSSGSVKSLSAVGGGHGTSYWLMHTALPIVVASVIIVTALMLTGNPIVALVAGVIGLTGFYIIQALVSSF